MPAPNTTVTQNNQEVQTTLTAAGVPTGILQTGGQVFGQAIGTAVLWANRPNAAANSGQIIAVSDVGVGGCSYWWSDGANWRPLNGSCVLYSPGGTITTPVLTFDHPGGNAIMPGQPNILIPAGMAYAGARLNVDVVVNRPNAGSGVRGRIFGVFGPLKTSSDPACFLSGVVAWWDPLNIAVQNGTFYFASATRIQPSYLQAAQNQILSALAGEITYNAAVDNYFNFGCVGDMTAADTGLQLVNYTVTFIG